MDTWEDRLLRSIHRAYATIGLKSEDLLNSKLPKNQQILEMAKEIGLENLYISYRMDCHATHGDWFDISRYFLEEKDGKFFPRFIENDVDIRKLNPILIIVYKTLSMFLANVRGHELDINDVLNEDLTIINNLDMMHHNFLNNIPLMSGIKITLL